LLPQKSLALQLCSISNILAMRKSSSTIILIVSLILTSPGLRAQKLTVRLKTGVENTDMLNTIQKLYFSNNQLVMDFKSGADDTYALPDVQKLYFDAAVFVDDHALPGHEKLSVYPNPVGDVITITGIPEAARKLTIYRMDGGLVMSLDVTSSHESINISSLSTGLYLVNASGFTTKFVKK
jgi:hypothetical protein